MNLLPDEPLWLLVDAGQRTAHGSVMEAADHLRREHPEFTGWKIAPTADDGTRTVTCEGHEWTVRPA